MNVLWQLKNWINERKMQKLGISPDHRTVMDLGKGIVLSFPSGWIVSLSPNKRVLTVELPKGCTEPNPYTVLWSESGHLPHTSSQTGELGVDGSWNLVLFTGGSKVETVLANPMLMPLQNVDPNL